MQSSNTSSTCLGSSLFQSDKLTYQKIDQAHVAEFLSGHANAFVTAKLIGQKEVDSLRIALSAQSSSETSERLAAPLLLSLFEQNQEFANTLAFLYGPQRLTLNLIRYILPNYLESVQDTLAQWLQSVSKKAELYFNQNLNFLDDSQSERQSLCSSILLEFAEVLAREKEQIAHQAESLKTFYEQPTTLRNDQLDRTIAANLGFSGTVNPDDVLGVADERYFAEICASLSRIIAKSQRLVASVLEPFSANKVAVFNFGMFSNLLVNDLERLRQFTLPANTTYTGWEVFRQNILSAWADTDHKLREVVGQFDHATHLRIPSQKHRYPHATQRNVLRQLMSHGLHLSTALTCCRQLFTYLHDNNARLFEILPGELSRISKEFPPSVLETVATWDKLDFEQSLTQTKSGNLERVKRFNAAVVLCALFCCSFLLGSCGLKLDPINNLPDLRPSIPFSEPASDSNQELKKTSDGSHQHE